MAKHLNVSLGFTADTSQAAQQIKQLQQQLSQLMNVKSGPASKLSITKDIQEALTLTGQLSAALNSSINTKTGNLDLGKFHESITKAGLNLSEYQAKLSSLGPAGDAAFANLAKSIAMAEIPIRRTSSLLTQMGTTIKNAARWQISSSIIHGFMGSVQTAWHYAQNLNESLNNIRIVTGQNTDQMAKFAEQANKTAKSLSTSTLNYTDAALIYYQQGLSDQEVQERTDVTVKLANVSRQSAEEVSDQLTAVWNNFDDGSRSLESYVDVMTALGATTASSSEEISTGLEKFAAVADTVGLSFDYAAAALATVTATTRQSADTVGTAFRTLFSRMEGLKLGETLEDGTDLNKYSQAMASIGVNIKDVNGDIKDMDQILDETAAAWQNLSKDQQIALAQTVGGVRQYTNFIALMDNWDFMQENLATAANAEGTLQEQADIYAESWEAAQKRVQASLENIYDSLINDKFFISLNNAIATVTDSIGNMIDALGGLDGLLLTIGTVVTRVFSAQIGKSIDDAIYSISMLVGKGREKLQEMQQSAIQNLITSNFDKGTTGGAAASDAYASMGKVAQEVYTIQSKLTSEQKLGVDYLTQQHDAYAENLIQAGEELEQEEKITASIERRTQARVSYKTGNDKNILNNYSQLTNVLTNVNKQLVAIQGVSEKVGKINIGADSAKNFSQLKGIIQGINEELQASGQTMIQVYGKSGATAITKLQIELEKTDPSVKKVLAALGQLDIAVDKTFLHRESLEQNLTNFLIKMGFSDKEAAQMVDELGSHLDSLAQKEANLNTANHNLVQSEQTLKDKFQEIATATMPFGQAISRLASSLMSFAMIIQNVNGIIDTLNNDDLSFWEKFLAIIPSVSMVLMGLTNIFNIQTVTAARSVSAHAAAAAGFQATGAAAAGASGGVASFGIALNAALGPIAIAIAVISTLAALLALVGSNTSESTQTLKKLEENSEVLKDSFNDTNTAAQELLDTIKSYREASTALEDLTVGTDAWRESLTEANNAAALLLANYSDLNGFSDFYSIDNGQIKIDQEGLEFLEKTAKTSQLNARLLSDSGSLAVRVQESKINNSVSTKNNLADLGFDLIAQSSIGESAEKANQFLTLIDAFMQKYDLYGQEIENGNELKTLLADIGNVDFDSIVRVLKDIATTFNIDDQDIINKVAGNIVSRYYDAMPVVFGIGGNTNNWNQLANSQAQITSNISATASNVSSETTIQREGLKLLADQYALNDINNNTFSKSDWADIISDAINTDENQEVTKELISQEANWMNDFNALKQKIVTDLEATYYSDEKGNVINRQTGEQLSNEEINAFKDNFLTQEIAKSLANQEQDAATALEEIDFGEQTENIRKILNGNINELNQAEVDAASEAFNSQEAIAIIENSSLEEDIKQKLLNSFNGFDETVKSYDPKAYIPTLDKKVYANFKEAQKVLDDLTKGDEISAEDYGKLGEAAQSYFQQMADGTYQLVEDAENLQDAIQSDAINALEIERQKIQSSINAAENYFQDNRKNQLTLQETSDYYQNQIDEGRNLQSLKYSDSAQAFVEAMLGEDAWKNAKLDENGIALQGNALGEAIVNIIQQAINKLNEEQAALDSIDASEKKINIDNIETMDDLVAAKQEGTISTDEYNDMKDNIIESDAAKSDDYDAEDLKAYMEALKDAKKQYLDTDAEIENAAKSLARWNKAVNEITEDYDDWVDALKESKKQYGENYKTSDKYQDTMKDVRHTMADLLNVEEDLIDIDFAENHLELMKDAAMGSQEAFDQLQGELAKDYVANIEVNSEDVEYSLGDVSKAIDDVVAADYEVGMTLNEAPAMQALWNIATNAGMTVAEIQDMFNGLGWHPEVTVTTMSIEDFQTMDQSGEVQVVDPITGEVKTVPVSGAIEMAADGDLQVVSINGDATYKTANGPNLGGSHASPGGKGGGGGGGSQPKERKLKKTEDETERYHVIKELIDDLERVYDNLSEAKDRAFGSRRLKAIDEEIEHMRKLQKATQAYADEAKMYMQSDWEKLSSYGFNIQRDESGLITNYDQLIQQMVDQYNANPDEEAANEWWDEVKKVLENYIESRNTWEEQQDAANDFINDIYDLGLEKVKYAIELKINFGEDGLDYLDWMLRRIEDDAFNAGDAIANLGEQASKLQYLINTSRQGINDVLSHAGLTDTQISSVMGGTMDWSNMAGIEITEDDIDAIKEYRDNMMDYAEQLWKLRKTVFEELTDAWDAWSEKIEYNLDLFEHYKDLLGYFEDIVDLVGINFLNIDREVRQVLRRTDFNVQINQLAAQRKVMEEYRKQEEEYMQHLNEARARDNEYDIRLWESYLNEVQTAARDAEEDMMKDWANTIEAAGELFEQMVDDIMDSFEDDLAGVFDSFDELQQAFNQQTEISDRFVEDYQKIYDLSKLNRDIQNSIDDNDSIKAKTRLRDLQKEINDLQNSNVKMSQYDLDYLRKKYELRLAEIQLEDVQNAKSMVRMSRDSENNWSYVYTANDEAMEEAYQNYEDKLYEMQELNTEYIKEMQDNILQSQIELSEAIRELDRAAYSSDADYEAAVQRLRSYYLGQYDYYAEEIRKALGNNKTTYDEDWTWYSNLTGYKKSADADYLDKFEETIYSQLTGYRDLEDAQDDYRKATEGMVKNLVDAFRDWQDNVEIAMETAGTSTEEFANTVYDSSEKIQESAAEAEDRTIQMAEEMTSALTENMNQVTAWQQTWSAAIEAIIQSIQELVANINNAIAAMSGLDSSGNNLPEEPPPAQVVEPEQVPEPAPTPQPEEKKIGVGSKIYAGNARIYWVNGTGGGLQYFRDDPYYTVLADEGDYYKVRWYRLNSGVTGYFRKSDVRAYKEGGLVTETGIAQLDGTFAQPEMVLNPEDTTNILTAVDVVRQIARIIDINSNNQLASLGTFIPQFPTNGFQELEQNVHITAEFPNATDKNEIYQAFESLTNMASQFAYRKNK